MSFDCWRSSTWTSWPGCYRRKKEKKGFGGKRRGFSHLDTDYNLSQLLVSSASLFDFRIPNCHLLLFEKISSPSNLEMYFSQFFLNFYLFIYSFLSVYFGCVSIFLCFYPPDFPWLSTAASQGMKWNGDDDDREQIEMGCLAGGSLCPSTQATVSFLAGWDAILLRKNCPGPSFLFPLFFVHSTRTTGPPWDTHLHLGGKKKSPFIEKVSELHDY